MMGFRASMRRLQTDDDARIVKAVFGSFEDIVRPNLGATTNGGADWSNIEPGVCSKWRPKLKEFLGYFPDSIADLLFVTRWAVNDIGGGLTRMKNSKTKSCCRTNKFIFSLMISIAVLSDGASLFASEISCREILEMLVRQNVILDDAASYVIIPPGYEFAAEAMKTVGIANETANSKMNHLQKMLNHDFKDRTVASVQASARRFFENSGDENSGICILGPGCHFKSGFGDARFAAGLPNFQIVSIAKDNPRRVTLQNMAPDELKFELLFRPFILRPERLDGSGTTNSFAALVLHEFTHLHDYELLGEWVHANLKLIRAGKKPDKIFSEYVEFVPVPDGHLGMERDFLTFFLESRAYRTQNFVHEQLDEPGSALSNSNTVHRERLMSRLINGTSPKFLKNVQVGEKIRYGLSQINVFEAAIKAASNMQITIDEARNLP